MVEPCMFLRIKDVLDLTGWSRATLFRRIADGSFPTPVKTPSRRTTLTWPKVVVDRWRERLEKQPL